MNTNLLEAEPNYKLALEFARRQYDWVDDLEFDYHPDDESDINHYFSFGVEVYSQWNCEGSWFYYLTLKPIAVDADGVVTEYEFIDCEEA